MENQDLNNFCEMCKENCGNSSTNFQNIMYIVLIILIVVFLFTIMLNSSSISWIVLAILFIIWLGFGMDTTIGLILLIVFLIILLFIPSREQQRLQFNQDGTRRQRGGQQKKFRRQQ